MKKDRQDKRKNGTKEFYWDEVESVLWLRIEWMNDEGKRDTNGEWWKWRSKEREIIIEWRNLCTEREREKLNDKNGKRV